MRALQGKTPGEAWTRKKPSISHLREFGCEVWVKREPVQKLSKIVKYYDGKNRVIRESRNVV
ncbi:hypothetical protein DFH08DRAFT_905861 [Mycena albidolilacea]|uniref:Uncharacterized protein n=1 Tax=Mycena albidolilacea TaxID=1033008 RepID=A0AAD7E7W1_9AGAR|nr:hypothetical protein DFH08DRAFT_905861 [Mycena albidolilacea]